MLNRQVYISSDWHLGGTSDCYVDDKLICGTSIFRATGELVAFIDFVKESALRFKGVTEFVINGDMVDFLAPDPKRGYWPKSWQIDESVIVERLQQIHQDTRLLNNGRGPFDAIQEMVAAGVELTVLLGNHDVELSLPHVRRELELLVGASKGIYRFLYDGEAYFRDGLLVEHGNRYDCFNCLDYNLLRQERSIISRGFQVDPLARGTRYFIPPMGSEIVVNEINPRLESAAFINLLKPEIPSVVPLLLALFPETIKGIDICIRIYAAFRSYRQGGMDEQSQPLELGRLSASTTLAIPETLQAFLVGQLGAEDAKAFAIKALPSGQLSGAGVTWESISKTSQKFFKVFDIAEVFKNWIEILISRTDDQRLTQIRAAFRKINEGHTFDRSSESKKLMDAAKALLGCPRNHVVVFGHTHFPKDILIGNGKKYLNAGAWADVARLPSEIASKDLKEADAAIGHFFKDMQANNIHPYLLQCRTYVHALINEDGVTADLKTFAS